MANPKPPEGVFTFKREKELVSFLKALVEAGQSFTVTAPEKEGERWQVDLL